MKLSTKKKAGFTIIELTVVAGIIAVLSLLVTLIMTEGLKSYRQGQSSVKMQDLAAKAIRDFESKTRGAEQIIAADADQIVFFAYIANDTRPAPSRIRYYSDGDKLVRGIISPEGAGPTFSYPPGSESLTEIAAGVQNPEEMFSYYDDKDYDYNLDETTKLNFPVNIAMVKMARISVKIDTNLNQTPEATEESTLVNLRNLKRNL